jgi:hypothetical protein
MVLHHRVRLPPRPCDRLMTTSTESLKNLHIIERIPEPEPFELLDSDDSVLGQMNREQLEAIVRRFRVSQILLSLSVNRESRKAKLNLRGFWRIHTLKNKKVIR